MSAQRFGVLKNQSPVKVIFSPKKLSRGASRKTKFQETPVSKEMKEKELSFVENFLMKTPNIMNLLVKKSMGRATEGSIIFSF
jgi:hypothetical protein